MTFSSELDVSGRPVVVVGGAAEALGSISDLLRAGATVTVVAPEVATSIRDLAERGLLHWAARKVVPEDLRDAALVVPATGDQVGDVEVRAAAARQDRLSTGVRTAPGAAAVALTAGEKTAVEERTGGADGPGAVAGRVILVGGGPGDPGLLTVAGLAAIEAADVVVCDRLAPLSALSRARADAVIIDVGKIPRGEYTPQERINAVLVEHARLGRRVVRLKGGDSFVFGRGGEEWQACAAAGIAVEVIPGVTSAVAAPALAGIPLTHRQLTQGFTVVSGHLPPGHPGSTLDWGALARSGTTLVVMMGVATLAAIATELVAQGLDPTTPAATVADAGMASQRTVRGSVTDIASLTSAAGLGAPAIIVIGAVAGFDPTA